MYEPLYSEKRPPWDEELIMLAEGYDEPTDGLVMVVEAGDEIPQLSWELEQDFPP